MMPDHPPSSRGEPDLPDTGFVETALLLDLSRWREALARSIARNNLDLRSDGIMTAVNQIIFPLLLIRIARERGLLPAGTGDTAGTAGDSADGLRIPAELVPYADAIYAGDVTVRQPARGPERFPVIDKPVLRKILDEPGVHGHRYALSAMTTASLARVLAQYLTRTVRRSAAHQATIVDTHDTVITGPVRIPPGPVVEYLVTNAVRSARRNRSAREVLPLRIFDPACGSGLLLLAAFNRLQEEAGGDALTFEERYEILIHSVYGLDISRHAVAATRLLLLLELCGSTNRGPAVEDFSNKVLSVLRDLSRTVLCGNALIGPEIADDESWNFCPARDRHQLNAFSYADSFPEIIASGGFDAIISNPPEGALDTREWVQQYFQRRYTAGHPLADRSAYFFEKALSLVVPGGTVAMAMSSRFLRGAPGSPFRDLLKRTRIEEIADLSPLPAGSPGAGLALLRVRVTRPARSFSAVCAGPGFSEDPAAFTAGHRFPVNQQALDAGGWVLRDTRADAVLEKVRERGTLLADVVMGQVHPGICIPGDDPFVINAAVARQWMRRDTRCREIVRPIIAAGDAGQRGRFLILVPEGWTRSHGKAGKNPWQWFRHRHPPVARHLQPFADRLRERAGPGALWWETACDPFWQERQGRLFFPLEGDRPFFLPDAGRAVGDETILAVPSSGQYLAAVLNSRLIKFFLEKNSRGPRQFISWDDLSQLPVYTPDLDRPDERALHERVEKNFRKKTEWEKKYPAAGTDPEREAIQKKIRAAEAAIDALVYELYGLTPEEIAVVEARSACKADRA